MRVLIAAAATLSIVLSGCAEDPATAMAKADAQQAKNSTPAPVVDDAEKVNRGLKPQRGVGQILPPGSVSVEFEPGEMAFGLLPPGADVEGSTRLWNTGTEPLTIQRSITSCGCTAAEDLGGRVIQPGSYTEFTTKMHMKSGLGEKKEKITVYFEPGGQRIAVQFYTAEVVLPVRLSPPHIAASRRVGNQWQHTTQGTLTVTALDGQPFSIIRSHGEPPVFEGFDPATDAPRTEYTLVWNLERFQDRTVPWYWVVETDHPEAPVIDARIRHARTLPKPGNAGPWVSKTPRLLVGIVEPGEPFEASASIEYHGNQTPQPNSVAVTSLSPNIQARLVDSQLDGHMIDYKIELTVTPGTPPGMLYGTIALEASRFSRPVPVIGRVGP